MKGALARAWQRHWTWRHLTDEQLVLGALLVAGRDGAGLAELWRRTPLNSGKIAATLVRLERRGTVTSSWDPWDDHILATGVGRRRYAITDAGRRHLSVLILP